MDDPPHINPPLTSPSDPVTSPSEQYDDLRYVGSESPCPYLPQRRARYESYDARQLDAATYERLMARWFRRSGNVVYRPRCRDCQACQPIRIPVARFKPTRSMRRVLDRNGEVAMDIATATPTQEKFELFERYLVGQHDGTMTATLDTFQSFLYDSPLTTLEFCYRLGNKLIGVSTVDCCPGGLSSVYMYFDPAFGKRSLGTLSVLREVEYARKKGLSYYYLGYYVAGSKTMAYKARFRPNEILVEEDQWDAFAESD